MKPVQFPLQVCNDFLQLIVSNQGREGEREREQILILINNTICKREGGRKGGREGGRERGREGGRKGGREGGRDS